MSSILTSKTVIDFETGDFPEPEAYTLVSGKLLILSENLQYILYDSRDGKTLAKGQFPEELPEDALPINAPYTYW